MSSENAVTQPVKVPARAWAVLAVVYFASAMAPLAQFKIPPLADWIIPTIILPVTQDPTLINTYFGLLMTAMSIIGVILAFPAAFIIRKFGLKAIVQFSLACLVLGSVIFAFSNSLAALYIGRLLDGIGIGLIGVAAPTCVSIWFPEGKRGLALGIWATWVPVGLVIMFNTAPMIANALGFHAVGWECAILTIVMMVLFQFVFKMPEGESGDMGIEGSFAASFKYLKNKHVWLCGVLFFCFCFCSLGITQTWYSNFLSQEMGFSSQLAGTLTSLNTAISWFSAPIMGAVFDKVKKRGNKRFVPAAMAAVTLISIFFMFSPVPGAGYSTAFIAIFIILQGIGAATPATTRSLTPMVAGKSAMAATMAMAALQFVQNLGAALGSPIYGALQANIGWQPAALVLQIPIMAIGIIAVLMVNPWKKQGGDE